MFPFIYLLSLYETINFGFCCRHFSLIARGNVERLEVVNKKWVRVVMVPGTETTTVSKFHLFKMIDFNRPVL